VKLARRDLVRIFFRSFMIQGLWTVQRAQNLGYIYSLWPVFRRFHPKREDRARAVHAHAGYFSTHPYTAGVLLGVVAGLEEDRAEGRGPSMENILDARSAMSGPLAALGETFFWGTWLPFSFRGHSFPGGPGAFLDDGVGAPFLGLIQCPSFWGAGGGALAGLSMEIGGGLPFGAPSDPVPPAARGAFGDALVLLRGGLVPLQGISVPQGLLWTALFWACCGWDPSFFCGDGGGGRLCGLFLGEESPVIERTFTVLNKMGLTLVLPRPWSRPSRNSRATSSSAKMTRRSMGKVSWAS